MHDRPLAPRPARWALALGAMFLALVAALHGVKPEIDPSWRFISEYAIGRHGWMMSLAFVALAAAYVALFLAVRARLTGYAGRVGSALLWISAAGLLLAGVFPTDPIDAGLETATTSGRLHSLGGTLGLAMPFAAVIVSWTLARHHGGSRRPLLWSAGLAFGGFLVGFVSLAVLLSRSGGRFGPDVPIGWPNRLEIAGYCAWLLVVASSVVRARVGGGLPR